MFVTVVARCSSFMSSGSGMTASPAPLEVLRLALLAMPEAETLEKLAAALLGRLLDVPVLVAARGWQQGGDAGTSGRTGRRLRLEAKRYAAESSLPRRELLGQVDYAVERDAALEAWILVTTRDVPEQVGDDLRAKGEREGCPVVILDYPRDDVGFLAALCSSAPDLVEKYVSPAAGDAARALTTVSTLVVAQLRRDLESWNLGFASLRNRAAAFLREMSSSVSEAQARFAQDVAVRARANRIRRQAPHGALSEWWSSTPSTLPFVALGEEGVGKTWAIMDWVVERLDDLPIVVAIPAPSLGVDDFSSALAVKRLLATRLREMTDGARDEPYWLKRVERILSSPLEEGPGFLLFFDGMNQRAELDWIQLLRILQAKPFAERVRVICTTRMHHLTDRLAELRGLTTGPTTVEVAPFGTEEGGELDKMLALEGIPPDGLGPGLREVASNPRLFQLAVKMRSSLRDVREVTVHRLLWEYGRDTLGVRAGRSFSPAEWADWLAKVAADYRREITNYSSRDIGAAVVRADLSPEAVYARLSDIVDAPLTQRVADDRFQPSPLLAQQALGLALVKHLGEMATWGAEAIDAALHAWIGPIAALTAAPEVLRAAASIAVARRDHVPSSVMGSILTAWLQSQNLPEAHLEELQGIAPDLIPELLTVVEQSTGRASVSIRIAAINLLRCIPENDARFAVEVSPRCTRWLATISRGVSHFYSQHEMLERRRHDRLVGLVGHDVSGPAVVLGQDVRFVDFDDGTLLSAIPSIIEGRRLSEWEGLLRMAAIVRVVRGDDTGWQGLRWLCILNEADPAETTVLLRRLATEMAERTAEPEQDASLPARVAAVLLELTGDEVDEIRSFQLSEGPFADSPAGQSAIMLEHRALQHVSRGLAAESLLDREKSIGDRVRRHADLWLDPTFDTPPEFAAELRDHVLDQLRDHPAVARWYREQVRLGGLIVPLARIAPDLLAEIVRTFLHRLGSTPPEGRYEAASRVPGLHLLVDESARREAEALRRGGSEKDDNNEGIAAGDLLTAEMRGRSALDQIALLVEADLRYVPLDLAAPLTIPSSSDLIELVTRYREDKPDRQKTLLVLISEIGVPLEGEVLQWVEAFRASEDLNVRGAAFRAIHRSDPASFGARLLAEDWTWSPTEEFWVNHYGSEAILAAASNQPFHEIAHRVAPWMLLQATRTRGARPSEVLLAASIIGRVLRAEHGGDVEPGAEIRVQEGDVERGTMFQVVTTGDGGPTGDDARRLSAIVGNPAAEHEARLRTAEIAFERIRAARQNGAELFAFFFPSDDFEGVLDHAPDVVEGWLDGMEQITDAFRSRVRAADGAYIALCGALLCKRPEKGVTLWHALQRAVRTNYIGASGVEELLHVVFRAPDSVAVEALRADVVGLRYARTDACLMRVAVAALANGRKDWLEAVVADDARSPLVWRRRRGLVLQGFSTDASLAVPQAWPNDPPVGSWARLRHRSGMALSLEASACHWWALLRGARTEAAGFASWILFQSSADRRAWTAMRRDPLPAERTGHPTDTIATHVEINRETLKLAIENRSKGLDKVYLGLPVIEGIGPWT
ncbi:hypothetical protein VQH23_13465 [Pararoseomonas sp. SCSIO 73927]|uniref:hypothetical protein n=1 Tax=Pararoseomonas sp. SCSIO 73927 TaxID=3114537 RepID=UPI0030CD2ECD